MHNGGAHHREKRMLGIWAYTVFGLAELLFFAWLVVGGFFWVFGLLHVDSNVFRGSVFIALGIIYGRIVAIMRG